MTRQLVTDELHSLTGWRRASDQGRWLAARGIPHQVDGRRVIVLWTHVNAWIEGKPAASYVAPNWSAVR